jgi:hypothetical protein
MASPCGKAGFGCWPDFFAFGFLLIDGCSDFRSYPQTLSSFLVT